MPSVQLPALKPLVDSILSRPKIDAAAARDVLEVVQADVKYSAAEVTQLERLANLPSSRFLSEDEFIPNPWDSEDGVTIRTDPKRWLQTALETATATLEVRSTIPGVSLKLSKPKEYEVEDFGSHISRELAVSFRGQTVAEAGTIDFTYGKRTVKVDVAAGSSMESVAAKLERALLRAEKGSLNSQGWFDASKRSQTLRYEVL